MAITECTNVSAMSRVVVQLFEHMFDCQFRSVPEATAVFQTKLFTLLPPISFLSVIPSPPTFTQVGVELGEKDAAVFSTLQKWLGGLRSVTGVERMRKWTNIL